MAIRTWTDADEPSLVVGGPLDGMVVKHLAACKDGRGFYYTFPGGHSALSVPQAREGTPKRISAEQANAIEVARAAHVEAVEAAKS